MMSSEHDFEEKSEQYKFVRNELKNSKSDWIVVCVNQAAYCSRSRHYPKECPTFDPLYPQVYCFAKVYHSIFETYNVDLVLHGHNHNYERSYPIKFNKATPGHQIKSLDTSYEYLNPKAPIFVTIGTAGRNLYKFQDDKPDYIVNRQDITHGFLRVDIMKNEELEYKELHAEFVSNEEGHPFNDWFTIRKTRY